jgi:hypothetical protein
MVAIKYTVHVILSCSWCNHFHDTRIHLLVKNHKPLSFVDYPAMYIPSATLRKSQQDFDVDGGRIDNLHVRVQHAHVERSNEQVVVDEQKRHSTVDDRIISWNKS